MTTMAESGTGETALIESLGKLPRTRIGRVDRRTLTASTDAIPKRLGAPPQPRPAP